MTSSNIGLKFFVIKSRIDLVSVIRVVTKSLGAITQPFGMESYQTKINVDESGQMTIVKSIGLSTLRVINNDLILDKQPAHHLFGDFNLSLYG
jgi:hypothetical protein